MSHYVSNGWAARLISTQPTDGVRCFVGEESRRIQAPVRLVSLMKRWETRTGRKGVTNAIHFDPVDVRGGATTAFCWERNLAFAAGFFALLITGGRDLVSWNALGRVLRENWSLPRLPGWLAVGYGITPSDRKRGPWGSRSFHSDTRDESKYECTK